RNSYAGELLIFLNRGSNPFFPCFSEFTHNAEDNGNGYKNDDGNDDIFQIRLEKGHAADQVACKHKTQHPKYGATKTGYDKLANVNVNHSCDNGGKCADDGKKSPCCQRHPA